ncbi:hypothetical protein DSECCO2_574740 [anaerobic digester metagenome]
MEFLELGLAAHGLAHGVEGGVHGAGAGGVLAHFLAVHDHLDHGHGREFHVAAVHGDELQGVVVGPAQYLFENQRLNVLVEDVLLAVGQFLDRVEDDLELVVAELVVEFLDLGVQGMAAGVLAEHDHRAFAADVFGRHDLVGAAVLQHAVLVDAGLVGKGVAPDDRRIGRYGLADDAGEAAARGENLLGDDARGQIIVVGPGDEAHDHLLQGGIAGALADAGEGHFGLARAGVQRGQGVGHAEAEVVVAVHGEGDFVRTCDRGQEVADEVREFGGLGVTHGVGDVDDGRAGGDHAVADFDQELGVGARGVLGRELDLDAFGYGMAHGRLGHLQHLRRGLAELVLHVQGRGGEEGVDALAFGVFDRLVASVDVRGQRPTQGRDHGFFHGFGDGGHGFEVADACGRKAGLDHVHAERFQLAGHADFFLAGHGGPGRLFAIPERGVKNVYPVFVGHGDSPFCVPQRPRDARAGRRATAYVG